MTDLSETQSSPAAPDYLSQWLEIAEVAPSPTNPRKTFPEAAQAELIESVKRHGIMQPILVRPWPSQYPQTSDIPAIYEVVAGERRYRAAKAAGLQKIPATVRDLDDHETLELQIVENLHRKDLNELEEAEGYELMIKQYGYTAEQLAEKIDKSKAYIYARLKLTALCEKARDGFRAGDLDASRALLIARIPTAALQAQAMTDILEGWQGPMNYRNAAKHVQDKYMLKLAEAPFPRGDAELLPSAGKCHPCPKRTGSNPELYPAVKSADICTDPECYAAKKAAHYARAKDEALTQGKAVIDGVVAEKLLRYGDHDIKGYVKLDEKCYEANFRQEGGYPTYRELIADKGVAVTLIQKTDGRLIEVVEESTFKAIAAEVGIKAKERGQNHDKERLAKEKAENAFRSRLFAQIRTAYNEEITELQGVPGQADMLLIARQFFSCIWHESQKQLANLWVPTEEKIDAHERIKILTDSLDSMTQADLFRFMVDCSLIGMTHVGSYQSTDTPERLLDTATRLLVSPDTIRREMLSETNAKVTGKAKGKKATKENDQTFNVGDYVKVIAYDSKKELVGTCGQVQSIGHSIAYGTPVYTLRLPSGWDLVAEAKELSPSSAAAFEAQQPKAAKEPTTTHSKRPTTPPIAYRHPENAELEWTGRGRQPKWVAHWIDNGGSLDDLQPKNHKRKTKTKAAACQTLPTRCDKTIELPGLDAGTN